MRFPHVATSYHFHLKDGGEMVVTANDPSGKSSIGEIRMQLIRDRHSFFPILDHQTGVVLTVGS